MGKILLAWEKLWSSTNGSYETCFKEDLFDWFRNRVWNVLEIEVDEEALYKLTYTANWRRVVWMIIDRYLEIKDDTSHRVWWILDLSKIANGIINLEAIVDSNLLPKINLAA